MQQKALLVRMDADGPHGVDELNLRLSRGWRIAHISPLGGGGDAAPGLAALVVLERSEGGDLAIMEQAESEGEELIEELSEGDGAGLTEEIDDDFEPPLS